MICALTVRKLKPGTFEEFREKFAHLEEEPPPGWAGYNMLHNKADENEVVTFGLFEGTLEELRRSQAEHGFNDMVAEIAHLVESVPVQGVYEFEIAVQAASSR